MHMKTFALLLLATVAFGQQKTVTVKDSLTKQPVPYVSVDLLNSYGVFTNTNGEAVLNDASITAVELSSVGYTTKKIQLNTIATEVYLIPQSIQLDEVVVAAKRKLNRKELVVKPKGHQNELKMITSFFGQRYAFYVNPVAGKDNYLTKIALPLMEKDFKVNAPGTKEDPFKIIPFKTLIKVEILRNENNVPGEKLNDFKQIALIDSKVTPKVFELLLLEEVKIPEDGLFVAFTIIGTANDNGSLATGLPYDIRSMNGKEVKISKPIQPNFPVLDASKGVLSYTGSSFAEAATTWVRINRALIYDPNKPNEFNIGFGYTTATYE